MARFGGCGCWAEATAGCSHVAHVASPFPLAVPKDGKSTVILGGDSTARQIMSTLSSVTSRTGPLRTTTGATGLATMIVAAQATPTERMLDGTVEADETVILTVAAAEAAVGLAIIIAIFRHRQSVNLEDINLLKG